MLRSILLASAALVSAPIAAQSFDSAAVSGLGARNIGSATMSGRISAVTGRQEADGKVTLLIGSAWEEFGSRKTEGRPSPGFRQGAGEIDRCRCT